MKSFNEFLESKMSNINVQQALQGKPTAWVQVVSRFPEMLQKEIIEERPNPTQEDIVDVSSWKLINPQPIRMNMKTILKNKDNLYIIGKTIPKIRETINQKWGINVPQGQVDDPNPERHLQNATLSAETAEPSVMVNGEIIWGVGRMISALLRGDQSMMVWNIKK